MLTLEQKEQFSDYSRWYDRWIKGEQAPIHD